MHQRKSFVDDNNNRDNNHDEAAAVAINTVFSSSSSSRSGSSSRRKRRQKPSSRRNRCCFRCAPPVRALVAIAGLGFGALWIRLLWKIAANGGSGSYGGPAAAAKLLFDFYDDADGENDDDGSFRLKGSPGLPSCGGGGGEISSTPAESVDVTLTTQLSDDRLWMMKHHCARYGGALSIAVYTNRTRSAVVTDLIGMGCRIAASSDDDEKKKKKAATTVRVLDARTHGSWDDYPVNALRNLALEGVRTTHALIADVDFWPAPEIHDSLTHPTVRERLGNDPKLALVVPAFALKRAESCADETRECRDVHVERMPTGFPDFRYMLQGNHSLEIFDRYNSGGHGSTDYQHWFQHQLTPRSDSDRLRDIPCLKSNRYEPFLVVRICREITPPFQTAFSGYGKNKMSWIQQVIASGFSMAQVGGRGSYLVHYPHAISASRRSWNRAPEELLVPNKNSRNVDARRNYSVRRPKASDGDLGFEAYPRGRIDDRYVEFREWLDETFPADQARLHLCEKKNKKDDGDDDYSRLWIDPKRKKKKGAGAGGSSSVVVGGGEEKSVDDDGSGGSGEKTTAKKKKRTSMEELRKRVFAHRDVGGDTG